jgi:hypothetical protein
MALGPQFDEVLQSIPKKFGSSPVPEGHVRVHHYTSPESVENIRRSGLSMQKAHESFSRGGTEFPSIFATAGEPSEDLLRARPVVEAHLPIKDLDIGRFSTPEELEGRKSTVTTNIDVPPENIIAVHEPWHRSLEYMKDSTMEKNIMSGMYSGIDEDVDKALTVAVPALAAKVMLGGKLKDVK